MTACFLAVPECDGIGHLRNGVGFRGGQRIHEVAGLSAGVAMHCYDQVAGRELSLGGESCVK